MANNDPIAVPIANNSAVARLLDDDAAAIVNPLAPLASEILKLALESFEPALVTAVPASIIGSIIASAFSPLAAIVVAIPPFAAGLIACFLILAINLLAEPRRLFPRAFQLPFVAPVAAIVVLALISGIAAIATSVLTLSVGSRASPLFVLLALFRLLALAPFAVITRALLLVALTLLSFIALAAFAFLARPLPLLIALTLLSFVALATLTLFPRLLLLLVALTLLGFVALATLTLFARPLLLLVALALLGFVALTSLALFPCPLLLLVALTPFVFFASFLEAFT